MHTDDFYHYLSKGAIPPHLPESNEQNLIVIEAFLEAAKRYARGGYDVIVDGITLLQKEPKYIPDHRSFT